MENLSYRDKFVKEIVQTLTGYDVEACEGNTPLVVSGEENIIILKVSLSDWIKLYSSVFTGADICYPDESDSVRWILNRAVECPVDLCQLIADCIASSEATQAALRNFITSDPAIREYLNMVVSEGAPMSQGVASGDMVSTDDLDALFGAVTYLVDTMNGANEDLYQAIEASSNNREGGQILFEAIPLFETLPLDEVSEYVDFMVSSVAENYASAYTTTPITGLRDRLRCGLFCLARDNGNSLSWNMIADYFWAQVAYTPADYTEIIFDFIEFVTTGSWSGEEIATISFANIASVLSGAQEFAGMTFPSLQAIMQLGLNDPDPDWETLCEDCPPIPVEGCYDFTSGEQGFEPIVVGPIAYASYDSGGWKTGDVASSIHIKRAMSGTITKVTVTMEEPFVDSLGGFMSVYLLNYAGTIIRTDDTPGQTEYVFTGLSEPAGIQIATNTTNPISSTQRIVEVCFEYDD